MITGIGSDTFPVCAGSTAYASRSVRMSEAAQSARAQIPDDMAGRLRDPRPAKGVYLTGNGRKYA